MTKLRLYSDSRLSTAKTCLRKFYFEYERRFRPAGASPALTFGGAWSAAMDVVWGYHKDLYGPHKFETLEKALAAFIERWTADGMKHPDQMTVDDIDDLSPRTPQIAMEMLIEYVKAREHIFTDPTFELLSIEEPFIVPLDPNDPTLFYAGLTDKKFRYRGQILGLDHKTTTMYRGTQKTKYVFASNWIDGWSMSDQVDGYNYEGHRKHGSEFAGVWIDGALVHKTAHDVFKIIPVDKMLPALDSWLWTTHAWIDEIEANQAVLAERSVIDAPYLAAFKQNRKACVDKWGKCAFFNLCVMHPNPAKIEGVPMGFVEAKPSPLEAKVQAAFAGLGQ